MKKRIGIILFLTSILSIPNQVFAELEWDKKSYTYGFFIGSMSETCLLYKYGGISAEVLKGTYESIYRSLRKQDEKVQKAVLKYVNTKKFLCKDFLPSNY